MIKLYGGRMGSSFRCHWMLAELGLSYENPTLDMQAGEHRKPEFLAINPAGQVPTMVYDDFVLTESMAIVHYLAEKHAPKFFGPQSPESHATLLRFELYVLLNLNSPFSTLASKSWGMPASAEDEAKATEVLSRRLPVFEAWLSTRNFVLGSDFSVGDIVTRSTFLYAEAAGFDLSAYPFITAWIARCSSRPAFISAMNPAQT